MSALAILDDNNYFPVPSLNTGASECSDKLNKVVAKAYRHIRTPLSRSLSIADLVPELFEVVEDCSDVNWDGYDALPIRLAAFKDSLSFMMSMPSWMPHPEVVPENSGDIGFQWNLGSKKKFAVSFRGDNTVSYAGLLGASSVISGKEIYSGSIPKVINESLRRIVD